jgi:Nickel responsive protein SCO4226-like
MAKLLKYMIVHNDPQISWEKVEENWSKLAEIENCAWVRTFFNRKKGVRYCEWLAPDESALRSIFRDLNISYESIVEVEETVPDLWGKRWEEHLAAEETSSTRAF